MSANSTLRRAIKRFVPLMPRQLKIALQALGKAKDIIDGSWATREEPELAWVQQHVQPGDTVIDVGANFGLYTHALSRIVGPEGRVYAFEPVPDTFATLSLIVRWFGLRNVDLVKKGCSDQSGEVRFSVPITEFGTVSAGLAFIEMDAGKKSERMAKTAYQKTQEVHAEVVALDAYLRGITRLSLLKIDVEGADLLVLKGARGLIETHKPAVLVEFEDRYVESYGISADDFMRFFEGLGYDLFQWEDGQLVAKTRADLHDGNYIFLPSAS